MKAFFEILLTDVPMIVVVDAFAKEGSDELTDGKCGVASDTLVTLKITVVTGVFIALGFVAPVATAKGIDV